MTSSPAEIPGRRIWTLALRQVRRRRSVILGYHGVAVAAVGEDPSLLQIAPDRFRAQVEMLLDAGFSFLTVAELTRRSGGGTPPPGFAALTFDDGMRNNHTTVLPILRELGIRATVYVTVDLLGGKSPWIGEAGDPAMLSEQELRELAQAGWEIGAHTMSHPDLSTLDYARCRREIEDSRDALQRITGTRVETFAYPFGRYGPDAVRAARDAGMLAAVTTGSGSWDPYELTRAAISAGDPLPIILLKLTDTDQRWLRTATNWLMRPAAGLARLKA